MNFHVPINDLQSFPMFNLVSFFEKVLTVNLFCFLPEGNGKWKAIVSVEVEAVRTIPDRMTAAQHHKSFDSSPDKSEIEYR